MRLLLLLALVGQVHAQTPNVKPEELDVFLEVDIRLKGTPTATDPFPTVRLIQHVRFSPQLAGNFRFEQPCWRTTGLCPKVVGMTYQLFLNIGGSRMAVTKLTPGCGFATECVLPPFEGIQAKVGQSYSFYYSRVSAKWLEPPSVK